MVDEVVCCYLENQDPSAFSHDKSISSRIKWSGGLGRGVVVLGRQRSHPRKPGHREGIHRGLTTACHHHIGVPKLKGERQQSSDKRARKVCI